MGVSLTTGTPSCQALSISSFMRSPSLLAVSLALAGEGTRVGRTHLGHASSAQYGVVRKMHVWPLWCTSPSLMRGGCWSLAPRAHCFKENLRETDAWFEWNAQKKSMCCQNSPVKRPCYIIPSYMCRAKCCHLQRARWYSNVTTNVTQHWVKQRARRCHQEIHNANDSGTNVQAIILTLFNTSNCSLF